jgi:hypothetical protein
VWHTEIMKSPQGKDRDFVTVARRVVEQAIGEHLDGTPLETLKQRKNPKAVAAGRIGGKKGGVARAEQLTGVQRSAIARKAARTRWGPTTE